MATRRPLVLSWPESHLMLVFLGVTVLSSFTSFWMRDAWEHTVMLV